MSFAEIPGQERAKRLLQSGLRHNRLSHAYIFSGPKGSGRRAMALKLAQAIKCTERTDDACGHCLACRTVLHRNNPDIIWVEPEGTSIKIDQIRGLQKEFAYRSTSSGTKIYMMDEADRMTVQAANALLKFLEEPLSDMMAVLITENGQALLPTIQSRAQWVPFPPASPLEMARMLTGEGYAPALVNPAVRLAAGLDGAREMIGQNWFAEARNVVIQLAKETLTRFPSALLTAQQQLMKTDLSDHLALVLDLWVLWFKDMIRLQSGREDIVYIDQLDGMVKLSSTRGAGSWIRCMEHAMDTQKRLRFHANPQLALEKLMIDIQRG